MSETTMLPWWQRVLFAVLLAFAAMLGIILGLGAILIALALVLRYPASSMLLVVFGGLFLYFYVKLGQPRRDTWRSDESGRRSAP